MILVLTQIERRLRANPEDFVDLRPSPSKMIVHLLTPKDERLRENPGDYEDPDQRLGETAR
jgi:hypothetical protein